MKWISVKDKLPPVCTDVLVYIYAKNCEKYPQPNEIRWNNAYYMSIERRLEIIQDVITYEGIIIPTYETRWSSLHEVLYWMSLPEKPKDKK